MSLALALALAAHAGTFTVNPTTLELGERHHSAVLVLENTGPEPIRFEATAYRWDESEGGEMLLDPTDELLVFPTLFVLAPGARQPVRVGVPEAGAADEQTWRVFIEELPALSAGGDVGVQVRTRMGIPVFLPPAEPQVSGYVAGSGLTDAHLDVRVVNDGNVHFRVAQVRVVGRTVAGDATFTGSTRGWYVLAGGTRTFGFDVPAEQCTDLAEIEVQAETDRGTFTSRIPVSPAGCGE
jgi:fimbrial chaperone protein